MTRFNRKKRKGQGKGEKKEGAADGEEKPKRRIKGSQPSPEDAPEKFAEGLWEQPREHLGLNLIGEIAPPGTRWNYIVRDDSRRSFAGYLPSPLSTEMCAEFFRRIRDNTDWKQPESKNLGVVPRKTCWMASRGCNCSYRYGGIEVEADDYPQWMKDLLNITMPYCGIHSQDDWPNCCNLNLYEDGAMSVGWHADDEPLFQGKHQDIRIISLSFGATRKFETRLNWPQEGERQMRICRLGNGDMMTMEGMVQKHMQHRVPREENITEPRINLTWRWVVKHSPRCPVIRHRL